MALRSTRQLLLPHFPQTFWPKPMVSLWSCALVGGITATYALYHLGTFFHLHWLHRSRLHLILGKDLQPKPYALITGATDGLGRAYADELAAQGFNIILHGRNATKLNTVRDALQSEHPRCQVRTITLDASTSTAAEIHEALSALSSLDIKILINNIGGAPASAGPMCCPHAARPASYDLLTLNINQNFTLEVTRAILPHLTRNASRPSLILNIGSGSARLPCPYILLAAATKAFLESFSRGLQAEMIAEGHRHVQVQYQLVGMCSTGSEPRPATWLVPSAKTFVRSSLQKVGSGWRVCWGYMPHALQFETISLMPNWLVEKICIGIVREQVMQEDEARRELGKPEHKPV